MAVQPNWIVRIAVWLVPGTPTKCRRFVLPLGVLTLLAGWTVLGELDSLLEGMRVADGSSFGMTSITSGGPGQKTEALAAWDSWRQIAGSDLMSPAGIRSLYLWVDFSFLVAYAAVSLGAIAGLWRRIEGTPPAGKPESEPWLRLVKGVGYLLVALFALDVVENLGLLVWPGISDPLRWCCGWPRSCRGSSWPLAWHSL